jgi:LysM repeat protein
MYYISQAEGIKLKLLYKWNLMKPGEEPSPGEQLNLRHNREKAPALLPAGSVIPRHGVMVSMTPKPVIKKDSALKNINLLKNEQKDSVHVTPEKAFESFEGVDSLGKYHIVQDGETVYGIAKNYGIPYVNLKKWNSLSGNLESGQKIYVSRPKNYRETPTMNNDSVQKSAQDTQSYYKVKQGETLYSVSARFHIPVDSLIKINKLEHYSLLDGQILKLRNKKITNQVPNDTLLLYHTVTSGETLYSIARQYHVTVEELIEWNGLEDNTLSVGQKLKIRK